MENLLVSGKILLGVNYTLPISDPRKKKSLFFHPLLKQHARWQPPFQTHMLERQNVYPVILGQLPSKL